jgi:hypothetical protein
MAKVTVTYRAPEDDNEVVTAFKHKFFNGMPVDLDSEAHAYAVGKLSNNQHFEVVASDYLVKKARKVVERATPKPEPVDPEDFDPDFA